MKGNQSERVQMATAYLAKERLVLAAKAVTDRGTPFLYGTVRVSSADDPSSLGRDIRRTLAEFTIGVPHGEAQGDKDFAKRFFRAIKSRSWNKVHRDAHSVAIYQTPTEIILEPLIRSRGKAGFKDGLQAIHIPRSSADKDLGHLLVDVFQRCVDEQGSN
jgi:hypothetical protein